MYLILNYMVVLADGMVLVRECGWQLPGVWGLLLQPQRGKKEEKREWVGCQDASLRSGSSGREV